MDEAIVAFATEDALRELGCTFIRWALTAADAERLAADRAPQVILMDLRLKGSEDGVALAQRLRTTYRAPIIFVTGHLDMQTLERIQKVSVSATLQKPYLIEQLRSVLIWAQGQMLRD